MTRLRWKLAAAAGSMGIGLGFTAGLPLAGADTSDFGTPGSSEFTVPANVCAVDVVALGAEGGTAGISDAEYPGGLGGSQSGSFDVTPGERLGVSVGGRGTDGNSVGGAGGVNGGGAGGQGGFIEGSGSGGGGGGASDVRQAPGGSGCVPECEAPTPPARAGSELEDRVVVAGGGGGAGGDNETEDVSGGGAGGGVSGGTPDGDGEPGTGADGGQAGSAGGVGGIDDDSGGDGSAGQGGDGGDAGSDGGGGGGGGGGFVGGGGGGGGTEDATGSGGGGGGGGGSSFAAPNVSNATSEPGVNEGDGSVSLSYTPEAPVPCEEIAVVAVAVRAAPRFTG